MLLAKYKMVMRSILEDSRLVQLQQEGGASLSWLRGVSVVEEEQAAVEKVSTLYNEVDELLHSLVTLSNCKTQELSFIQDFGRLEQAFSEVGHHNSRHTITNSLLLLRALYFSIFSELDHTLLLIHMMVA